jgi:TatA/E family protein of Tat protein translocase
MLSMPHLIVLFVVALVIFGPQKLPELARMLGKATAEFRKMTGDFRYALEEEVRELDRQTRIREAETAAAASPPQPAPVESAPAQSSASEPEGSVPRVPLSADGALPTDHSSGLLVEPAPAVQPQHHENPVPTPVAPDSATPTHEKNPNDNSAA